jgi:lysophospholipase L1-like esterase
MSKQIKRLIYFVIIPLIVIGFYLYFANGFIYYRIGAGNLSAPITKDVYFMNNNQSTTTNFIYVALGDSLTSGAGTTKQTESFPYDIAERLVLKEQGVTLKNLSYPGATTQNLINDLLDKAIVAQPDMITLLIGVNDMHNHVSLEQFRANYTYILERLSHETKAKIYIINLPFIGSNTAILPPLDLYFNSQTEKFNNVIKELASEYNLKYIDLYSPTKDLLRKDGPHYSSDSFHPSASGYKWWANIIYDSFDK